MSGAVVYDLTDHTPLFALRPRVARWPASVEKLYTSIAILRDFGPHTRLQTEILGAGHLARGGVWRGDLYLRGGGDPTFGAGGTLTDVTNLAGYCHSRRGKRLAFALFIDGPPNWRALQLESAMVAAIARLWGAADRGRR